MELFIIFSKIFVWILLIRLSDRTMILIFIIPAAVTWTIISYGTCLRSIKTIISSTVPRSIKTTVSSVVLRSAVTIVSSRTVIIIPLSIRIIRGIITWIYIRTVIGLSVRPVIRIVFLITLSLIISPTS